MRRNLLKAALAFVALLGGVMFPLSVSATDWVGNEPSSGKFYLYNVAAKAYLGTGANWGTRAVADHAGLPLTLTDSGSGTYTILTNVYSKWLNDGGYMDGTTAVNWTFEEANVDGKKVYYLHSGDKYLYYKGDDSYGEEGNVLKDVMAVGDNTNDAASQWQLVTEEERNAAYLAGKASEDDPLDVTYKYIPNPNTASVSVTGLYEASTNPWKQGGDKGWNIAGNEDGWQDGKDKNMEVWNGTFNNYISLSDIPNGVYEFGVQGFYRDGSAAQAISRYTSNNFTANAKIYANSAEEPLQSIAVGRNAGKAIYNDNDKSETVEGTEYWIPNGQLGGTLYFFRNKYPWQSVKVQVTDGNLQFGVKKDVTIGDDWTLVDKFYLSYVTPAIDVVATALPEGGEMEAGKWYYFDIAVEGEYEISATTLSDIIYTTEGNSTLITDEESVSDKLEDVTSTLAAGRYCVKSSTENTLTVEAKSYSYTVGDATTTPADGEYIQKLEKVTLTYADAVTNDKDASLAIVDETKKVALYDADQLVKEATLSAQGNVLTATFDPAVSLELGKSYTVKVEAGIFGYEGQATNEELTFTVNAPVVADGTYYLYDAEAGLFLGRGAAYGTEAVVDRYGVPFNLTTDAAGASHIEFVDWTGVYLYKNGTSVYTDQASTGWKFVPADNGYYLTDADGSAYTSYAIGGYGYYVNLLATTADNATVWSLLSAAERDEILAAYPAENISAVIESAGIATDAENFEALLANFDATDMTEAIGTAKFTAETKAGDWTWTQIRKGPETDSGDDAQPAYDANGAEIYNLELGYFTQTISKDNLPAGIYKVTVDGYERRRTADVANQLGEAGYNLVSTYLKANDEQVRLKSWYDVHTDALAAGLSTEANYPNWTNQGGACFDNEAVNTTSEVYVYLDGNTDLELTVRKPNYSPTCWVLINNFTLTLYTPKTADVTITEAGYTAYVTTFDVDFTQTDGVTAYKVTKATADGVELEEITEAPVGEAVILEGDAETYTLRQATAAVDDIDNEFKPGGEQKGDGTSIYALGYINSVVGFYLVANGTDIPEDKGYLEIANDGASAIKAFIPLGGEATGIEAVGVQAEAGEAAVIYNLAGQRVQNPTSGIYIVNGKKVLINK